MNSANNRVNSDSMIYDETGKAREYERMSVSQAVAILEKGTGAHFDAAVVAALKKCLPSEMFTQ